jgi:hypothetical protein
VTRRRRVAGARERPRDVSRTERVCGARVAIVVVQVVVVVALVIVLFR